MYSLTRRHSQTLLLSIGALLTAAASLQAEPAPSRPLSASLPNLPVVTRHTKFDIPFTVESAQENATVELHVSRDQGKSWQVYGRQPANTKRFQFAAEEGGEYWFASRLAESAAAAQGQLEAELRVLIDFDEPKLEFESKVGPAGRIVSTWQVTDPTLDPHSLKIEYQTHPRQPWRTVSIDHQQGRSNANSSIGKTTWLPENAQQAVQVRAEISDRAGNRSVVNRVVILPPGSQPRGGESDVAESVPADPFRRAQEFAGHGVAWPADNRLPNFPETPRSGLQEHFVQSPAPPNFGRPEDAAGDAALSPPDLLDAEHKLVVSPFDKQPVAAPNVVRDRQPAGRPADAQPKMIRSPQFELDYTIESTANSGVLKVELWGTSDDGKTWSVWKLDEDQSSPVEVSVEQDGVYGFQVVVVAKNGLAGPAPRNGDPAELWVGVDSAPPAVRIESAAYGDGDHFGQLDIRWTATDPWLSDKPITLLFSDQPTGPWTTIRPGLANNGQHFWSVDPRVPEQIFLKIEARDQAGNVGVYQLEQPISTGGLTPRAHIDGIRAK